MTSPSFHRLTDGLAGSIAEKVTQMSPNAQNHDGHRSRHYTGEKIAKSDIANLVQDFLRRCNLVYPETDTDRLSSLIAACEAVSVSRGYITPEDDSFRKFIPAGVAMGYIGYAHHPDENVQLYVTLYTAFLIYCDDMFENDILAVQEFNGRFMMGQPQKHWILDHLATFLRDTPRYFNTVSTNLIITSTLNLVTALSFEYTLKGAQLEKSAVRYPGWGRIMCGAAEAYSLFIFSKDVPLGNFLQSIPDIMIFTNYGNDVLSFYKEEMGAETINHVHSLAKCRNVHHSVTLREITEDAIAAHHRALETLKPHKDAYDMYQRYSQGYVEFHTASKRYRLDELNL